MSRLAIYPYRCPYCVGGYTGPDEKCLHCAGTSLTDQPAGGAERAPRPPAVMRTRCVDCAYRPGSPELEACGAQLPDDEPFFCHQGLPVTARGAYMPVAMYQGLPLGAMVCAGWWAMRTGEQLPDARPYREVGLSEQQLEAMVPAEVRLSPEARAAMEQHRENRSQP